MAIANHVIDLVVLAFLAANTAIRNEAFSVETKSDRFLDPINGIGNT